MNRKKTIAVIFLKIYPADYDLINGITAQANRCNCDVLIFSLLSGKSNEECIYDLINFEKTDGIIFLDYTFWEEDIREKVAAMINENFKKPVICLNSIIKEKYNFYNLRTSDKQSIFEITSHLIEKHNHKKIYCLTGPSDSFPAIDRLKGYQQAMKHHNLKIYDSYIHYGDFWTESGKKLGEDIAFERIEKPDAVVCTSDMMAISLIKALRTSGIKVPEEIAVTGFDALNESIMNNPSLTTYCPPNGLYGSTLVCRLLNMIEKKERYSTRLSSGKMILNSSCGCNTFDNEFMKKVKDQLSHKEECTTKIEDGNMYEKLLFADTIEKFIYGVDELTYLINGYERFFLCLNSDFVNGTKNSSKSLSSKIMVMIDKVEFTKVTRNIHFKKEDTLPALHEDNRKPRVFYFTPLCFNGVCYGFSSVIYKDKSRIIDHAYILWNKNVSNALHFFNTKERSSQITLNHDMQSSIVHLAPKWLFETMYAMSRPENFIQGLPRLLEITHCSQEHIIRTFKKYLGKTPTEYINDLRLTYAADLILQKNYDITDACFSSGFNNISHFYHKFKEKYNCSPGEYIKRKNSKDQEL